MQAWGKTSSESFTCAPLCVRKEKKAGHVVLLLLIQGGAHKWQFWSTVCEVWRIFLYFVGQQITTVAPACNADSPPG